MRRVGRAGLILVTVSALAARASAQAEYKMSPKAMAEQLEAEAQELAASGDMLGAAAKFREAHALDPRPELLCNVGVAYHKAKDLPRAQLWLSQCLARGSSLDAEFVTGVRSVLAAAEDKLREGEFTPVDIVVDPAGATVVVDVFGADDAFVGSRLVYVPFGTRTITVTSEGYRERTETVEATARDQRAVRIVLERAPVVPGPVAERPSKTPAIIATVATAVVGLGAGVAYLQARARASDAADAVVTLDEEAYDNAVRKARNWQKLSWIGAGAAGAGAIAAGWLWYRYSSAPTLEVAPTEGGIAVTLSGTF
jgi:hypothetical protein